MAISQGHLSLDAPVTRGEDNRLLDYLPDSHERGSDADAIDHSLAESIDTCFRQLREREAVILRLYFGLDSPEPRTLEEIGAMLGATWRAGAGEQQAQVIVDLGDRADRGARIVRGGFLLDGDRRTQALDEIDIRLVHARQELPCVGRQRFDIATLALGVQGIEGE